jgi:glycerol dehydrogenase
VIYATNGDVLRSTFHQREVQAVLVDMDLLVRHCPPRMLAAGIADAAAKYPEIAFSIDYAPDWEKSVLPSAALALAKFNWDAFEQKGAQAVQDVQGGKNTGAVEDCVCQSIAVTGTVSSLVSGGRQLAIAHTLYDGVCKHFKDQQRAFLHGEIVSAGIPLQLHVNGAESAEVARACAFLAGLGTPVRLSDLGIPPTPQNLETLCHYICRSMDLSTDWMRARVRTGLESLIGA